MYQKVLVANRGEIAVRIIRVLKELGIRSVAIYSRADVNSLHVKLADEAVCVGGPMPVASYLNERNILSAAILTGAQAIHPGFGFLSESSEFAQMCAECQIDFIGPKPETIDLMGDKAKARHTMHAHNIPVIPGSVGTISSLAEAKKIAADVGYPVLLKAAAGGGGKGIRRVDSADQLAAAFEEARREAKGAFNDSDMYLEKIISPAKHVEVQIFRDQNGHGVYFPERDCSLQRNHQKVLEETPCPVLNATERQQLGETALAAASVIDYVNTGTVEFLMDSDHHFYFMEMNTRIQVEHPITEMVTGTDLVRAQILVAAGLDLPFAQSDLTLNGYALECRINAEDPDKNFMPSAGHLDYLYLPTGGVGVRIDSGVYSGGDVSPYYDSMIAKFITHGQTRDIAIARMRRILEELDIEGIQSNRAFQRALLDDPTFLAGAGNNSYIEAHFLKNFLERHGHKERQHESLQKKAVR
ncbi:acetyl-CoA carboxylase, biotin carboxylase subunit [Agrilactobacillus composti DSM 18527 = JCM 14202]|uniref:biotin carboxylase n=1 Tax=Agrilactobacillus composti DSM 18527 = JCM 14202 TaxID=1423734 RepID=X0PCS0_9LACO|nr:acetyl-CoA carboxylase biotin carboxylase subunit [Agrilactobacillus composti]KRM33117.1 acetyl-CoA carboxylase, biotin carboxylase subunit [Agrilactobacillus composti DSM 18527 = JCM 14202]GAF38524.1 biotin carboxylase of acetyl-CoA carboxylase [Agrilactobacillus composti DSM 18527 = JCM 14202]